MIKTLTESVSKPSVGSDAVKDSRRRDSCRTDAECTMLLCICYPRAKDWALRCITMIITQGHIEFPAEEDNEPKDISELSVTWMSFRSERAGTMILLK